MTAILQSFIEALRNELQQFGEMLALLDQEHQAALGPAGEEKGVPACAIDAQRSMVREARAQRQLLQRELAAAVGEAEVATFAQLLPLLPPQYRPLVSALVQENHELLQRVEQRAQQNQVLLQRSLDCMSALVGSFPPASACAASGATASLISPALPASSPGTHGVPPDLSGSLVP